MNKFTHKHKLTGRKLRIKKNYGEVASCYCENPVKISWHIIVDTIVCRTENLIEI